MQLHAAAAHGPYCALHVAPWTLDGVGRTLQAARLLAARCTLRVACCVLHVARWRARRINGVFGSLSHVPIHFIDSAVSRDVRAGCNMGYVWCCKVLYRVALCVNMLY
jgi:hypothetical protein